MESVIENRLGTSREARRIAFLLKCLTRPVLRYSPLTPPMLRLAGVFDWGASVVMRPSRHTRIERVRLDGFHGEWIRTEGITNPGRVILYLHGDGFFSCGLRTHRNLVAGLAARSDAVAFSVAYRQLPGAPLSTSMADALASYRWLLDQGYGADDIVIAGDSAGGFLAFTTVLSALEAGLPVPAGIVTLSPLADLDHVARKPYPHTRKDAYIPAHRLKGLKRLLLAGMDEDPSPSTRDLTGLPPVFIMVGSREALRFDAELMAARLAEAGVPHRLQIWEDQVHVFPVFAGVVPEGAQALDEIAAFVYEVTPTPRPTARAA
ncbi:alpha/beta hydrolase fold domain-containing protein [Actinomadura fulvescens]|uniref:Alpha/beta hydrolase fold domain-containing protein n=1 Tax=Actinomadura fulvescens TaxID=46160 RepID=A0ABN3PK42_9ACTN